MYVYDFKSILNTAMKNRSEKEIIQAFTDLTGHLERCGINQGFHFMDNDEFVTLKMTMTSMNIKYQLVPLRNHRANNE